MGEVVNVSAKLVRAKPRICDIGGWTDTHFARSGRILNLSVLSRDFNDSGDFQGIDIIRIQEKTIGRAKITIFTPEHRYGIVAYLDDLLSGRFNRENLLFSTLSMIVTPKLIDYNTTLYISSIIPPGASMGTSATVSVALFKIFGRGSGQVVANLAHKVETDIMGCESGTQDQFAAAFSYPVNIIVIDGFPKTTCRKAEVSNSLLHKLEKCIGTIFFGKHNSSAVHRMVIEAHKAKPLPALEYLKTLASCAEICLINEDLAGFGDVMKRNTEAQRSLHPDLVSWRADDIIELAKRYNALGWKINGAGGGGGTVTVLFPSEEELTEFLFRCELSNRDRDYRYFQHKFDI